MYSEGAIWSDLGEMGRTALTSSPNKSVLLIDLYENKCKEERKKFKFFLVAWF